MSVFPAFSSGPIPVLVAAIPDQTGKTVLTFTWPAAAPEAGQVCDHYTATLWADAERTTPLCPPQTAAFPQASFAGIPKGVPFLLDVAVVELGGAVSSPLSLMKVSPFVPGQGIGALPAAGLVAVPDGVTIEGLTMPLRPVYGTVDGVKRWARVVTFGSGDGQVTALDVMYFLMAASDDIDAALAARYAVPLTPVKGEGGAVRYPPPVPAQCDRLAASMLLASRRAGLSDTASAYADGLETSADAKITALAESGFLVGQSMASGFLPKVFNAAPRQFTLRGDPAGGVLNPVTGYSDLATFQPHALPYAGVTWRYGLSRTG